jgi:hypothetical protein
MCIISVNSTEENVARTGRRSGRRRKQLLYNLKQNRRYWKLEDEGLDRALR